MKLAPALTLAALLPLAACGARGDTDLAARVLFTANGSYDAQADVRDRLGGGQRRVVWTTRPPLAARAITVRFDSNVRPLSWDMQLQEPRFSARDLAGPGARTVQTPQGEGLRPRAGQLADVLILPTPQGLHLLTRGYVNEQAPDLLPAFGE